MGAKGSRADADRHPAWTYSRHDRRPRIPQESRAGALRGGGHGTGVPTAQAAGGLRVSRGGHARGAAHPRPARRRRGDGAHPFRAGRGARDVLVGARVLAPPAAQGGANLRARRAHRVQRHALAGLHRRPALWMEHARQHLRRRDRRHLEHDDSRQDLQRAGHSRQGDRSGVRRARVRGPDCHSPARAAHRALRGR